MLKRVTKICVLSASILAATAVGSGAAPQDSDRSYLPPQSLTREDAEKSTQARPSRRSYRRVAVRRKHRHRARHRYYEARYGYPRYVYAYPRYAPYDSPNFLGLFFDIFD